MSTRFKVVLKTPTPQPQSHPQPQVRSNSYREALALALAAVPRIGGDSPASLLASDPMLLQHLAESFLKRHPLVDAVIDGIASEDARDRSNPKPTTNSEERGGNNSGTAEGEGKEGREEDEEEEEDEDKAPTLAAMYQMLMEVTESQDRALKSHKRQDGVEKLLAKLDAIPLPKDLVRMGAVEAIGAALERFKSKAEAVALAIGIVKRLAMPPSNRKPLLQCGALSVVITAMKNHHSKTEVFVDACETVDLLCDDAEAYAAFGRSGGAEALVAAMSALAQSPDAQAAACETISRVSGNTELAKRAAECGAVEAVLVSIAAHTDDPYAMECACAALHNLAVLVENKQLIAEKGGVGAIVTAMRAHDTERGVQEWGAGALHSILSTQRQYSAFVTGAAIDVVRSACTRFPQSTTLRDFENSLTRKEDPSAAQSRAEGVCSLVYAPICEGMCPAKRNFICHKCAITQIMYSCTTCDGTRSTRRYCDVCWRRCHAGHDGVERFIPGTCVCDHTQCKTPLKKQ